MCCAPDGVKDGSVAPFVGAWIEIYVSQGGAINRIVAPFVGAWIEIPDQRLIFLT